MELNLKFNRKSPDMTAARKFLEAEEAPLESLRRSGTAEFKRPDDFSMLIQVNKIDLLKNKINENINLYCELEALERGRATDVVETELRLVMQKMDHEMQGCPKCFNFCEAINLLDTDALLKLGLISHEPSAAEIYCSPRTVAVCYLFAQHAQLAGFRVQLYYCPKSECGDIKAKCVGVITEKSDVDSAVDMFLSSAIKCDWGVRRLYVQESCYTRFKQALSWKSALNRATESSAAAALCSEVYFFNDKVFLLDFAGTEDQVQETKHAIMVEPFRTVKELLSLVEKNSPSYMSVWSSDISEANEIAYTANVPIVWINDYAAFDGPYWPIRDMDFEYHRFSHGTKYESFFKNYTSWTRLSVESRQEKLIKCMEDFVENKEIDGTQDVEELIKSLRIASKQLKSQSVVIEKGKMWVTIKSGKGVIMTTKTLKMLDLTDFFASVICGNGLFYDELNKDARIVLLLNYLNDRNLPFLNTFRSDMNLLPVSTNSIKLRFYTDLYNFKRVCTNFGTIFAN